MDDADAMGLLAEFPEELFILKDHLAVVWRMNCGEGAKGRDREAP